jgi:hypothetical protein
MSNPHDQLLTDLHETQRRRLERLVGPAFAMRSSRPTSSPRPSCVCMARSVPTASRTDRSRG